MPDSYSSQGTSQRTNSKSIFPKGPSFTLENFSNRDFIVKEFIESLTEGATPSNRRSLPQNQAFDPKPLIRAFEQAQRRLNDLSGDLELRENELSAAVRRAEAQHSANTETLGQKLNQTVESFHKLDTSLKSSPTGERWGGNMAVETGRQLEELDRQRRRALDARFLIECWDEVSNKGEVSLLENLRRSGGGEGKVRSAHIARQLKRISQRLDPQSWGQVNGISKYTNGITNGVVGATHRNTREIIEKFSETLEKDLLKSFDDFYRRANFDGMRDCATVLQEFNGGASAIGLFVNQHQFFIDRSQLISEEVGGDAETWERLADPDAEPPGIEPSLQSLIDEVRVVVQDESLIIKKAFPFYEEVLTKFLQRVFQQSIQQRLEMVLDKASTISSLAFLRTLQASRSYISGLVDDLKAHGLTEHPDNISPAVAGVLDQQLDDLFVPYFIGSAYIDREKKNLEELYRSLMFKFEIHQSRRKKVPTTFMATLAKSGSDLLASARDAYMNRLESSDITPTQRKMLMKVAGIKEADSAQKPEIEMTEEDGRLSLPFTKRMLKWLAEGVGRGLDLSGGNETPKDVAALLNMLLENMGTNYIELALDAACDQALVAEQAKTEPDLTYLPQVRTAIGALHLMTSCIDTVLTPLAASSLTIRREMEKNKNIAVSRMEDRINILEQRTVDAVLNYTSRLLSNQRRNDFRPRDDAMDATLGQLQTPTCLSVSTFLARFYDSASLAFDGHNLTVFLTEIAIGIRTQLLEHFKKFQVNPTGAFVVTQDMTKYTELLRSWPLEPTFSSSLEILLEIGNLFAIGPEALRERLRGGVAVSKSGAGVAGALAGVGKESLRPYVLKREDAGSVGIQSVLNSL